MFINDSGDVATLYGQGKQNAANVFSAATSYDPDCANIVSYWDFEYIKIDFKGSNKINSFSYLMVVGGEANYHPPRWNDDGIGLSVSSNSIEFIHCFSFATYANDTTKYTDTVTINGLLYKGVNLCDSSKVLYNYHYGILRFIDANKKTWTKKF